MARKALIHKNTNQTTNNGGVLSPKLPTAGTLQKGEIAVNYKDGYETLSIENDQGEVVPFASLEQIMSYVDNSLPDLELSSNYSTSDLENEDLQLAEGDSYEEAFSKLEKAILDNEETIAASLNDLNTRKIEIDDIPTKTSQLTNDSGFLTSHQQLKTINNQSIIGEGNITIEGGSGGGDINVIETVKVNGTALTPDANKAVNITVPAAITESTVSGWGFTKNTGTYSKPSGGIPPSDLADSVQTSLGKADTALQSFTESDPTVPSHVKEITTTDISNWNNKLSSAPVTSVNGQTGAVNLTIPSAVTESTVSGWGFTKNSGTVTGVKMNGTTKNPTSGVVDLGTVLTSFTETDPTVPAWAKATNKPTYTAAEVGALPDTYIPPVTSVNGQTGAVSLTIPAAVTESTVSRWGFTKNAGTITGITMNGSSKGTSGVVDLGTVITEHQDISGKANTADLATVATSGSYNDLSNKPTIPAAQVQSDWNATSGMGVILNKPTIPTVNNATLTIQKNGTTVNTFTANASSNVTANIQINELPTVSSSDNGKILQVVNGVWALVTPTSIYSGTSAPDNSTGNDGDLYLQTS